MAENLNLVVLHDTNRNEDVLPITHENAVFDAIGKSVGTKLTELSGKVNALTAEAIDTDGLECSVRKTSGSGTTITIENTSENNYTIHCITKTGYTYVLIKLPSGLVAGKQYKITYTYSSTSSSTANLVFANAFYSNIGGFSQFLANTRNKQVSIVYTHQSDYVYLMTFNNDISTGADITINDLTITVPHSIIEIENRISALEPTVTPSAYYNGMHVELGNDYGYVFTTTSTSIRCNEGMAMYGDYLVCAMLAAGTTYLNVYKKTDGVYSLVESFSDMSLSHANAMQFAPTLESGQTFPLLYVAGCTDRKCYVVQISVTSETVDDVTTDTYSASIVQTISLPTTEIFATTQNINAQIGDDGYLYVYHLNHGCIRLRCPKVSEGETITMTEEDVYDYYEFHYPYATYVWQGGVIHKGMLFMPVGNSNKTKCLFVFDIYNHSLKALINLDAFMGTSDEPEDADVYNGELYIAMYAGASATSSKAMKKIKFL